MFNSITGIITGKFPKQVFLQSSNGIELDVFVLKVEKGGLVACLVHGTLQDDVHRALHHVARDFRKIDLKSTFYALSSLEVVLAPLPFLDESVELLLQIVVTLLVSIASHLVRIDGNLALEVLR